jgi:hypothetical protein
MTFSSSRKTVDGALSKLEAAGDPLLTLQVQHGSGAGLAAQLCTKPSALRAAFGLRDGPFDEADAEGLRTLAMFDGQGRPLASGAAPVTELRLGVAPWLQDAFWSVTAAEAAALALDAIHAALALALVVAPWRRLQRVENALCPV